LRAELGQPPARNENPLVDGHSPSLHLALFSKWLADKQPDWPPQTIITGFPWYDEVGHPDSSFRAREMHGESNDKPVGAGEDDSSFRAREKVQVSNDPSTTPSEIGLLPELERFLNAGPPPIVFTLGSAVAINAGQFFEHSAAAAKLLGRRAILICKDAHLVGPAARLLRSSRAADLVAFNYAPFSQLFPRAAAIVHHGGIGTTGQGMRAGRPMLIMPCAWDQPDNAARAARLGIARTIARRRYTPTCVAAELRRLLNAPAYSRSAAEIGEQVRQEDGVRVACDALENMLRMGPIPKAMGK
jgi:UDP:flavonoid glycosyltransferase YjiC (YdhE family)